jgi:hypothetical protein
MSNRRELAELVGGLEPGDQLADRTGASPETMRKVLRAAMAQHGEVNIVDLPRNDELRGPLALGNAGKDAKGRRSYRSAEGHSAGLA